MKISPANALSVIVLLGAIFASWYSVAGRVHELESQAAECKSDHLRIENLQKIMAVKNPDQLPNLLGTKSAVHEFGARMFEAGVAADQAEMPRGPGTPVPTAPVATEKK